VTASWYQSPGCGPPISTNDVLGNWNDPTMWDTGVVPISVQACIPAGKIAVLTDYVELIGNDGSQTLRIQGTPRVTGTNTDMSTYGDSTVENTGTLEAMNGGKFLVGNSGPPSGTSPVARSRWPPAAPSTSTGTS
jgi:hypothetical protein